MVFIAAFELPGGYDGHCGFAFLSSSLYSSSNSPQYWDLPSPFNGAASQNVWGLPPQVEDVRAFLEPEFSNTEAETA